MIYNVGAIINVGNIFFFLVPVRLSFPDKRHPAFFVHSVQLRATVRSRFKFSSRLDV